MIKIEIPYFSQTTLYRCSVACIRMILAKFNIEKTEEEIESVLNLKESKGIDLGKIQKFFDKLGFKTIYDYNSTNFEEALQKLNDSLKKGIPVIALVNRFVYDKKTPLIGKNVFWENERFSLHYVVITGIDKDFIYFSDPHEQIGRTKLKKEVFAKAWSHNLPWKFISLTVRF